MNDSRLVYSTDIGRVKQTETNKQASFNGDGIVRIRKETKGRKGKGMSIVCGLDPSKVDIKDLCSTLKKQCGCGGSVKGDDIEIQGDVRDKIKSILEKEASL